MFNKISAAIAIALTSWVANAQAQYYSDITANYDQYVQQQNQMFAQMEQQIVNRNLQDPRVAAMYQQHRQQGGQMSPERFAQYYAETGGCTPQGIAYFNNVNRQIQQQDQTAINNYRNYVNNLWTETNNYRREVNDRIAYGRGENLSGNGTYGVAGSNYQFQLPYTSAPGTYHYDNNSGYTFYMDGMGTYWVTNGNGYWQAMQRR